MEPRIDKSLLQMCQWAKVQHFLGLCIKINGVRGTMNPWKSVYSSVMKYICWILNVDALKNDCIGSFEEHMGTWKIDNLVTLYSIRTGKGSGEHCVPSVFFKY